MVTAAKFQEAFLSDACAAKTQVLDDNRVNRWKLGELLNAFMELEELRTACSVISDKELDLLVNVELRDLCSDSRELVANSLFVALEGQTYRAEENIHEAVNKGALAVIAEGVTPGFSFYRKACSADRIPLIKLPRLHERLSRIASVFLNIKKTMSVFGVTGTNGKTTCAWMLAKAHASFDESAAVVGTLGYGILRTDGDSELQSTGMTTPDAVKTQRILAELACLDCSVVAMEVSSHALSQWRVAAVDIKTAIFTNLSHDHLDYHSSMEEYAAAKIKLFKMDSVKYAVINLDDPYAHKFISNLNPRATYLTYSTSDEKADVRALRAEFNIGGIATQIHTPIGELDLNLNLIGRFNLSNALAVIAGLLSNGKTLEQVASVMQVLSPPPGRAQRIGLRDSAAGEVSIGEEDIVAVVDFAHTPDALKNILQALKEHCVGELWCVFGCGGDRDKLKRAEMARVAELEADRVVVTRDNSRSEDPAEIFADICQGFSADFPVEIEPERKQAINNAVLRAGAGDVVLIAGKGHEQFIDEAGKRIPFLDAEQVRVALELRMGCAA